MHYNISFQGDCMKSKIDVTIFQNGDMDILHASIYNELWKDYETFKNRALRQQEKGTPKGDFLAKRYERTALQSLYTFFTCVVEAWMGQISMHHREYTSIAHGTLQEKCDAILEYAFLCTYTDTDYDGTKLNEYVRRYEQHDIALMEYVTYDMLSDLEGKMTTFFTLVEALTKLKRFPKPDKSTTELVNAIGDLARGVT